MSEDKDTKVAVHRPPVEFRPQGGLVATNFEEAYRMASAFAGSGMVPKAYADKPEACFVAMQMGAEIGLPALQAIQNIAVINGKPGIYGDIGKALLLQAGCVIDEDDTEVVQKNGRARCKITRPGRPPVERTFSIDSAKTANLWGKEGPWKTYPWRQMAWRAFWFAARDAAADLLRGMKGAEELQDYPPEKEVAGSAEFVEQPKRVGDPPTTSAPQVVESQRPDPVSSAGSSPAGAEPDPTIPVEPTAQGSTGKIGGNPNGHSSTAGTHAINTPSVLKETGGDDEPPIEVERGEKPPFVDDGGPRLTPQQITILNKRLEGAALTMTDVRARFGWKSLEEAPAFSFNAVAAYCKQPF